MFRIEHQSEPDVYVGFAYICLNYKRVTRNILTGERFLNYLKTIIRVPSLGTVCYQPRVTVSKGESAF
jgi:hypothetical protein